MQRRSWIGLTCGLAATVSLLTACSQKTETVAATTTVTTVPPETTTTTELPITAGKQIFVWVPEPGDCWDLRKPDITKPEEVVLKLDCNLPHSYEIFGVVDVGTKEFPGDPIMKAVATKECPKLFKPYVGAPYETSKWEIDYRFPAATEWSKSNKHVIGCYLKDKDKTKKLEGTKKGSAM